jgi:hypothetical protein
MAVHAESKLPRNAQKPIRSGASVGRQRCSRAVIDRGHCFVQQSPHFFACEVARPTGRAPRVAHFICRCSKEFPFQGVKQRRQSGSRVIHTSHGQDQVKPWRSMVRRIRRRIVSYSTSVRPH